MNSVATKIPNLEIESLRMEVEFLKAKLEIVNSELETEKYENKLLRTQLFSRKSEKLKSYSSDVNRQSEFAFLSEVFDEAETTVEVQEKEEKDELDELDTSTPKKKKGRIKLPDDLPREEIIHDISKEEKICKCGCELTLIGTETKEQLDYVPARLKVIKRVYNKYACKSCEDTIKLAKAPLQPIQKSIATSGLLSNILVSKYQDHLPLYRQSMMFERNGINLSRKTLSKWTLDCGDLLQDLVDLMAKDIVAEDYASSDETTLNVLSSDKSKSYMWVHMSGNRYKRAVVYKYHDSRSGDCAMDFFKDFKGYHQSDAYGGYNKLHSHEGVTWVACMAHARRKFHEVASQSKTPGVATKILEQIGKLYKIEKYINHQELIGDAALENRKAYATPILNKLKIDLEHYQKSCSPSSPLAKAINYTLSCWEGLTVYLKDPRLRIDNNDCERAIKPFAVGRKNWMFCNAEIGAKSSANIYSIIETCKANNINAYKYLKYVLENIRSYRHKKCELVNLLPYNIDPNLL
jgi:transposase